jgi:hypothetical protein
MAKVDSESLACLHPPRQRQAGDRADDLMQLVAVERTGRPGADRRAVAPSSVRVRVGLALRAALVEIPLAVGVGRHVAGVDSDRVAKVGHLLVQGDGHPVKAGVQQRLERPQLGREAVAGVDTRDAGNVGTSEGGAEGGVLADQGDGAGPGRQGVEALGEGHADHGADRVAGSARPAGRLKLSDKLVDLGTVEQARDLYRV